MDDTSSQLTVPEATDTVEQHQHGELDPHVTTFLVLKAKAEEIRQRIQAKPLTYILTEEELAVLNYNRSSFEEHAVVQQAKKRFWNQFRPKPLDDQGHKERKEIHKEIPKSTFSQEIASRQASPKLQNSFKPFIHRPRHNSDRQFFSDGSTAADNSRAAYVCERCRRRITKCSAELPACQLCKEAKMPCVYTDIKGERKRIVQHFLYQQALENENGLLDSPDAPLEQTYLHTNLVANREKDRQSRAAKRQQIIPRIEAFLSRRREEEEEAADGNQVANGSDRFGRWEPGEHQSRQNYHEEDSQALTRDSAEARDEEVSLKRGIACEGYTDLTQGDIRWVSRAGKQDGSTPETRKVDPGHMGSLEAVGAKTPHEKSKVFFETHSAQVQSTISEGSQPTQSEPIPQTPQVHQRLPECPENLSIDRTRLLMHVSDGEEYGLVNSIKIWVQSLTRASWDWWPLHPSFRQLREDEVRIKWYCVSHYPRCLYPGLLNVLKGIGHAHWTVLLKSELTSSLEALKTEATSRPAPSESKKPTTPSESHSSTSTSTSRSSESEVSAGSSSPATSEDDSSDQPDDEADSRNNPNASATSTAVDIVPLSNLTGFVLFGVHGSKRLQNACLRLAQIDVAVYNNDDSFFDEMTVQYGKLRGFLRRVFSIWIFETCEFIMV